VALPQEDRDCLVDFLRTLQVLPAGSPLVVVR
jgi:hypothetical protein